MAEPRITPRILKGFRDYLPARQIPRERVSETAREVFRSFGFSPIDTPALEYAEILTGKGGEESDKQMYRFEDHGGRKGRSDNLGYQCIMRHCIKGSRQVYGHTHCTVRWFPLVEACLDVRCELEEGRCSRVSGSEAVLIFSW